jgi:hypothetical protein
MFHDATTWNIVGSDEDAGKDVIDRLRATLDHLPQWMLDRASRTPNMAVGDTISRDKRQSGATVLTFGLSRIYVLTGSVRKLQGRAGKVLLDDFGKHEDQERKWQLLYPVIDDPDPKQRGQIIIIFNGNGQDFAYHLYQSAKRGEVNMTAKFGSWTNDPRRLWMLDVFGQGARCTIADRETVYPWYVEARRNYLITNPEADDFAFRAQFPSTEDESFYLHGNSRFMLSTLNRMMVECNARERARRERDETWGLKAILEPHEPPIAGQSYAIGVDTAGGGANADYCVIQVGKVLPGPSAEQVAVFQARIEPAMLTGEVVKAARWYNEALVNVEANGHGGIVLDRLKSEYYNLYYRIRKSRLSDENSDMLGFWMDPQSRHLLIDQLAEWVLSERVIVNHPATVEELTHFEVKENGTCEAPKGMHDDLVLGLGHMVEAVVAMSRRSQVCESRIILPWEA